MDEDECEEEIDVDEVVEELQGVGLSEKDSEMGQRGSVEMNKIVVTVAEQDNETDEVDEELQWVGLSQKDSEMGQRESVEMDKITELWLSKTMRQRRKTPRRPKIPLLPKQQE
jgi:hypothetical protein